MFEHGPQFAHRLKTPAGRLLQTPPDDALEPRRCLQGRWFVANDSIQYLQRSRPPKRTRPREHLVQNGPETEDVRPRIERLAFGLLRRHVRRRAQHNAVPRPRGVGIHVDERGHAEIEQLRHALRGNHDVARFQVAVQNARAVSLLEAFRDLPRDAQRLLRREARCAADESIGQRLPFDELQNQIVGADVVDLADIGVVERSNRARFLLEPVGVLSRESLHRDDAIEPSVARFPHFPHATGADEGKDLVGAEPRAGGQ